MFTYYLKTKEFIKRLTTTLDLRHLLVTFLCLITFASYVAAAPIVEVFFSPVEQTAERNSHFTTSIIISSNETINVDGVDANFFYDSAIFINPKINSNIGAWMISLEDVSVPGKITYQKGSDGVGQYYTVTAGVPKILYTIEFKVDSAAAIVTKTFNFQSGFVNITAQGEVGNLVSNYNIAEIGILLDSTPPITKASHGSGLYNAPLNIILAKHNSDRSNDLKEIHYTLSDTPGNTPNMSSPIYTAPI
jgi:hypothetical protein